MAHLSRQGRARAEASRNAEPVSRGTSKEQTREALIASALELFAEQGLDAPSLDAICERAGYTRGAFYVHFADRDALLVAVMEKVGEAFLSTVFAELGGAPNEPAASPDRVSLLAETAERFVAAVLAGSYPLMAAPGASGTPRTRGAHGQGSQIRFHQLLDACARSPVVRGRYRALVDASVDGVARLVQIDRDAGELDPTLDPQQVGTMVLATIIGAQTMAELGVPIDPRALAATLIRSLKP